MKYFTIKPTFFQVPTTKMMEKYKKVDKFMELLEKSGVGKIIENVNQQEKKCKGPIGYNPYNLFAAIIFCFAFFKGTLRDIEDKCTCDIRLIYIMEGNTPDYTTIGNFINKYIVPYQYEIFTTINKQIIKDFGLDLSIAYIDGTKIEANANRYKFVWKPKKHHKNLDIKIKDYITDIGYTYTSNNDYTKSDELNEIIKNYVSDNNIDINDIPNGKGCRRTKEQRNYKLGFSYLSKLVEYEEKEEICGDNRNSYYKTDIDATAMPLKRDYYSKNSHSFCAAYNIQAVTSSGLVTMYGVSQDRTDYYTLIPTFKTYKNYYGDYPNAVCADAGYGIYDNYKFLKENNIENYIKFQQWETENKGKNSRLFKINNENKILCLNDIEGKIYETNTHPRIKNGKYYIWEGCNSCPYKEICKKGMKEERKSENYRIKEISIEYEILKEKVRNNLVTPKGIEARINRSIQAEGTFGQMKWNMDYDRIRRRGLEKVGCEIMLQYLGANIRKTYNSFDDNKFKNSYWDGTDTLQ